MKKLEISPVRLPHYALFLEINIEEERVEERFLLDEEFMMDVISSVENQREEYFKKKKKIIEYNFVYKIILKVQFFFKLMENDIDTLEMYYSQNLSELLQGKISIKHNEAVSLASLALCIDLKQEKANKPPKYLNLEKYLPKDLLLQNPPDVWTNKIINAHQSLLNYSDIQLKMGFLEILKKFDLYMAHQFIVNHIKIDENENKNKGGIILGINPLFIVLSDLLTKKTISKFFFGKEIVSWGISGKEFFILETTDFKHFFKTSHAKGINFLVDGYFNLIQNKNK